MYKLEVLAVGETKWVSNLLRFDTVEEAEAYGIDLACRWLAVKDWRITPAKEGEEIHISSGKKYALRAID